MGSSGFNSGGSERSMGVKLSGRLKNISTNLTIKGRNLFQSNNIRFVQIHDLADEHLLKS